MPEANRTPDAILCGRDYPRSPIDRDLARNQLFGPFLGAERVYSREVVPVGRSLITGETQQTFMFSKLHPRHPDLRHDWFVAVKTDEAPGWKVGEPVTVLGLTQHDVLVGFLKDDPHA